MEALIENYMLAVMAHYRAGSPSPPGYDPEDKDGGYRSALRHYGAARTKALNALASKIIYGGCAINETPAACMPKQIELF